MNGFLLDTHTWLWTVQHAVQEVSPEFFGQIEEWQRKNSVFLSPVSVWEVGLLVAAKQLDLAMSVDLLWSNSTERKRLQVQPLTARILVESTRLPGDLHRDPADRMLIATAREHGLTLVTGDKLLLQYAKHGHLNARKP